MFETLVTGVLTNVLGSYIDPKCFSGDKINVGVWSGYVVLRDLELKPDVIAHPAVNLVRGVVGSIELKIPWNHLQSESVVLTIDDVYLLARTEEDIESVLMEMDEFTIKKQILEKLYEEAKTQQAETQMNEKSNDNGFASRLINKIIDNIELHIRRIHLRFEDYVSGDHPFSMGLTVESVHVQSTNASWQPSFVDSSTTNEPRIYKIIELNHLSLYLDPHCEVINKHPINFETSTLEEFCHAFNHSIPKRFDDRHIHLYPTHQQHHFVLKPVDAGARLIVNRDPFDSSIPKFEVDISIAEVAFRLEESQYCDLLYLAAAFQIPEHHKKYQQYRKFRPKKSVGEFSAKEWWAYAIKAVMEDVKQKKRQWSWKYMKERRDDRKTYMRLWRQHQKQIELRPNRSVVISDSEDDTSVGFDPGDEDKRSTHSSGSETIEDRNFRRRLLLNAAALEAIERKRNIEDILFFRYLASILPDTKETSSQDSIRKGPIMPPFSGDSEVGCEGDAVELRTELQYQSWGKWMFGWTSRYGAAPSPSPIHSSSSCKRGFPEVELRELFKILEFEPAKKATKRANGTHGQSHKSEEFESEELDKGVDLVSRITVSLLNGSITLASDIDTNHKLKRDDPNYGNKYAPNEFLRGSFSNLQVAAITQGESTKINVSLESVEAFDESADSMAFSRLLTRKKNQTVGRDDGLDMMNASGVSGPIFLMSYETNPVGSPADAILFLHMEPLEIVFSPTARCWGCLATFLNTPQDLGLWDELEVASFNDIVNLKARTEAKLKYVMANRVGLSVDLRIQAPVIIIPESDTDYNCARMVVDLGHIRFRTDRLSKLDNASVLSSNPNSMGGTALARTFSSPLSSSMSFVKQLYDEAEKGEGGIRWKEEFYDKFTVSVTNVHVLLVPYGKAVRRKESIVLSSQGDGSNTHEQDWELVEHFSINVTVRTSVLPLDATLTRLYINADLPAITFNMSLEKYFQLMCLVERFNMDQNEVVRSQDEVNENVDLFGSRFLDEDGSFVPERRQSFLSTSALKKMLDDGMGIPKQEAAVIDSDGLSDAESDDTWFSITSGNLETVDVSTPLHLTDILNLNIDSQASVGANVMTSDRVHIPNRSRKKSRVPKAAATAELLDRRLLVCTFTAPVITIQLKKPQTMSVPTSASFKYDSVGFDDDIRDNGTMLVKFEGFRIKLAQRTLSTQMDVSCRSLEVEDCIESSGRSSEYLLFSCPIIDAPYDLQAPLRRGGAAFTGTPGLPRRQVSTRQRERVIALQRSTSGPNSPSQNLIDLGYIRTNDRHTGNETSRDLDVQIGAIQLVFDQSYVCSLIDLFEETTSKFSLAPASLHDDATSDQGVGDSIPPTLELTPTFTQEYSLPVKLTESVLADLERAREQFLQQGRILIADDEGKSGQTIERKGRVRITLGLQIRSISACFCDRGDPIASVAVIGTKLQAQMGIEDTIVLLGSVADVKLFDLGTVRDSVKLHRGMSGSEKSYIEIFGMVQNEITSSPQLVSVEAKFITCNTAEASKVQIHQRSTVSIRFETFQVYVHSPFVENLAGYIIDGPLYAHILSTNDRFNPQGSRRQPKHIGQTPDEDSALSPPIPGQSLTPFFDAVDDPTNERISQVDQENSPMDTLVEHDTTSTVAPLQFLDHLDLSIKLTHPSMMFPCGGNVDTKAHEGILVDFGIISIQSGEHLNKSVPSCGTSQTHYVQVNLDTMKISMVSDHSSIVEHVNVRIGYEMCLLPLSFTRHSISAIVTPVTVNIGEQYLTLGLDVWTGTIQPLIEATNHSSVLSDVDSVCDVSVVPEMSASSHPIPSNPFEVHLNVELQQLRVVLIAKPCLEFEGTLKSSFDVGVDSTLPHDSLPVTTAPGSPRRRRAHRNPSYAEEFGGSYPSINPPRAFASFSLTGIQLKIVALAEDSQTTIDSNLTIDEVAARDMIADDTEFLCDVLNKAGSSTSTPQITLSIRFPLFSDQAGEPTCECDLFILSGRICVLPRALLRIERYTVDIVIGFAKKWFEQNSREPTGALSTGLNSLDGSNEKSRQTRRDSIVESLKEARRRTLTSDELDVVSGKTQRKWKICAEIVDLQIWILPCDRRRDATGLCLSSRVMIKVDQHGLKQDTINDVKTIAAISLMDANLRIGSLRDSIPHEFASGNQSWQLVEPFSVDISVEMNPSVEQSAIHSSLPSDLSHNVENLSTKWRTVQTSVRVGKIMSSLAFRDLSFMLDISRTMAFITVIEDQVRKPLSKLASDHSDPFSELDALGIDGDAKDTETSEIIRSPAHVMTRISIEMDELTFRLVNNLVGEDSAVGGFYLGPVHVEGTAADVAWVDITCSCSFSMWYHNLRLVTSEPLVEPWTFEINCSKRLGTRVDETGDDTGSLSQWKVGISSTHNLQINMTDALIMNAIAAQRAWEWVTRARVSQSDRTEYSAYWIRNQTGMTLRYWGPTCRSSALQPGADEPLTFSTTNIQQDVNNDSANFSTISSRQLYISVEYDENSQIEGLQEKRTWESEFAIAVDQPDSRMYALVDLDGETTGNRVRKCECVIDVLVERGCKVFVVRSTLMLENNTSSDLEVEFVTPLRRLPSPDAKKSRGLHLPSWKSVIPASASLPLPINLVASVEGYLMIRPPDISSPFELCKGTLPKSYAKERVHLPLLERDSDKVTSHTALNASEIAHCVIKFHRLYGDRPVRPFMMRAALSVAKSALYHRKLSFYPPLIIHNLTAAPLEFCLATPNNWIPKEDENSSASTSVTLGWEDCQQRLRERGTINVADSLMWHICDWDTPLDLRIRINGFEWSDPLRVDNDMELRNRIRLADVSSPAYLHVNADAQTSEGRCRELLLYVPYWIVNLTGLKLEYEFDDERAHYEHPTMLLAGQKRLDRDELLMKEQQLRPHQHQIQPHVRPHHINVKEVGAIDNTQDGEEQLQTGETRKRRRPCLLPSIPPIKGLLDLLSKGVEDDSRMIGELEVLQACHSSTRPERGSIRLRVTELERQVNPGRDPRQSKWSEPIALDQAGTSGDLEAADYAVDRMYALGFSITTAAGRYSRTKVIMLTPRFMIINALDSAVEISHSSVGATRGITEGGVLPPLNQTLHLDAGGYADFHWTLSTARSKTIRCRLADYGWSWTGAVPLNESGEYVVRMRNETTRAIKLVRAVLKLDSPCVCVYLREELSSAPPYRIENYSLETFRVHQQGVRQSEILLPHHSLDYAWDEPTHERLLVVDMLPSAAGDNSRPLRIGTFALDKIQHFPDALGGTLGIEISADGPTRVLRFTDTRLRAARNVDASGNTILNDGSAGELMSSFPHRFVNFPSFMIAVYLHGVGISIVDQSPKELVYLSFTGLSFEAYTSQNKESFTTYGLSRLVREQRPKILAVRFQMKDFQIDNQLHLTPYPVLLRFSNSSTRARTVDGLVINIPVMEVCIVKHDGYAGINFIRHFSARILPLHVRVDGSLLYQLLPVFVQNKSTSTWETIPGSTMHLGSHNEHHMSLLLEDYNNSLHIGVEILEAIRNNAESSVVMSSNVDNMIPSRENRLRHRTPTITSTQMTSGKIVAKVEADKFYFEEFFVDAIRATVSFSIGASANAMVDGIHTMADSSRDSTSISVGPLRLIINAIGTSLSKIANAPFHLKSITISHSFIQPDALASRLGSHYQSEALRQAYVILGSVDVFGNPMLAWRNMRGGFHDFINEPVHGISKRSPTEFVLGVGRGTYSLTRASVYTFLDFNARILNAFSLGLSEACLKLDEYTGYPATRNIYQGLAQGISGMVVAPIHAIEVNGVRGIVPGLFAGVFGLFLKPLLGFSLGAVTTVATLRDATDPNTKALLVRARPPRHIDLRTRKLKVYSYVESFGEELVGKLRGGRYRADGYLGHVDLRQNCVIVTRKNILYVSVKPGQKLEVEWELPSDEVLLVDFQAAGEESVLSLFYIEEDFIPRRRVALAQKGMLLSKHVINLPESKILFVRSMLQQQDRPQHISLKRLSTMPSPLHQNNFSMTRMQEWQNRFPLEYPVFNVPMLVPSRGLSSTQVVPLVHRDHSTNDLTKPLIENMAPRRDSRSISVTDDEGDNYFDGDEGINEVFEQH